VNAAISTVEALRVVADGQRHRILTQLIAREMTARDLAGATNMNRTRLYYHLNLLERHGFIRVVGEQLVSGIPERTYRATAREFRVDRELLSAGASEREIGDAQALILEEAADDLRARSKASTAHDDDVFVARSFLRLSDERRRELRKRFRDLLEEFPDCGDARSEADSNETELIIGLFTTERES
jgi:DNA-binding transcriptional ArsR family regulator